MCAIVRDCARSARVREPLNPRYAKSCHKSTTTLPGQVAVNIRPCQGLQLAYSIAKMDQDKLQRRIKIADDVRGPD
jgi:hypothetical protein